MLVQCTHHWIDDDNDNDDDDDNDDDYDDDDSNQEHHKSNKLIQPGRTTPVRRIAVRETNDSRHHGSLI